MRGSERNPVLEKPMNEREAFSVSRIMNATALCLHATSFVLCVVGSNMQREGIWKQCKFLPTDLPRQSPKATQKPHRVTRAEKVKRQYHNTLRTHSSPYPKETSNILQISYVGTCGNSADTLETILIWTMFEDANIPLLGVNVSYSQIWRRSVV